MRQCEYCKTELPEQASFCGHCGRVVTNDADDVTGVSEYPTADLQNTSKIEDEEDEEEKRRRVAVIGLSLPVLAGSMEQAPTVPVVQGTPQLDDVPTVQGTSGAPHMPRGPQPNQQLQLATHSPAVADQPSHHLHHKRRTGGFMRRVMVTVVATTLIVGGMIGAGYTVLSPSLSLSGSTHVMAGQSIHLHGNKFIPGSSVTLTLDGAAPLYHTSLEPAIQLSSNANITAGLATLVPYVGQTTSSTNSVVVSANGTFDVIVDISTNLSAGQHTIRATEQISRRSAILNFTVEQPGQAITATPSQTVTPIPTETPTPTQTPSPTVTPSPSPTSSPATTSTVELSCINPGSITLTANQGSNRSASKTVALCTSGAGLLTWTASWDHTQAAWLQLDHISGQIQAPGQGQVQVSAAANGLKPGTYSATVTFGSQPGNTTESLSVSFTVQAPCISVKPGTLTFTGIVANSDPSTQTVTLSNCGNTSGNWSASTSANWLTVKPANGTVNSGATQNVNIGVSVGNLKVGTYNGNVTFTLGSSQASVKVTFTLQAPTLSVSTTSLDVYNTNQCSRTPTSAAGGWDCTVTVTNKGDVQGNLDWSATSSGVTGITFTPSNGTLASGQSTTVTVFVPYSCQTSATLSFTGPANTVNVALSCAG